MNNSNKQNQNKQKTPSSAKFHLDTTGPKPKLYSILENGQKLRIPVTSFAKSTNVSTGNLLPKPAVKVLAHGVEHPTPLVSSGRSEKSHALEARLMQRLEALEKHKEKPLKKIEKNHGMWDFLTDAVSTAAHLLPAVLPLFLANHAPTQAALTGQPKGKLLEMGVPPQLAVSLSQGISSPINQTPVGLSYAGSMKNMVGISSIQSFKHPKGGQGLRMTGMDIVTSLSTTGNNAGDILVNLQINPVFGVFSNTRLSTMMRGYEKYRFTKLVFIYEPIANATQTGQLVMFCDPDPINPQDSGAMGQQIAGARAGMDSFQIWAMGACNLPLDKKMTDFFLSDEGSDQRLIDSGRFVVMANSALGNLGALGNVYVAYTIEALVPQFAPDVGGAIGTTARFFVNTPTSPTAANPWGSSDPNLGANPSNTLALSTYFFSTGYWGFYNFPIGAYLVEFNYSSTFTAGASPNTFTTNGVITYTSIFAGATTSAGCAVGILQVTGDNSSFSSGVFQVGGANGSTSWSNVNLRIAGWLNGVGLTDDRMPAKRYRTLQDYEKKVVELVDKVAALENKISFLPSDEEFGFGEIKEVKEATQKVKSEAPSVSTSSPLASLRLKQFK